MGEVLVEVCFQDKLRSIRVDQRQMEIPNSIKAKSVREWFEPATGRVKWAGLTTEIKEMNRSNAENAKFVFQFTGPEMEKQEFMACVRQYHLGEEAKPESVTEKAQDYLSEAKSYYKAGNEKMAFQNYEIAARDYGLPEAQYEVAKRYENGICVEKNEEQAFAWYRKAAEQGYAEAQFELGNCYQNGLGTEKEEETAVKWYEKAAEQEHTEAQFRLGGCYCFGKGVDKNYSEAVKWWTRAADKGSAKAQYNLGVYNQNIANDPAAALEWYRKAAKQGNEEALQVLELEEERRRKETEEAKALEQNECVQTKDNNSGQQKEKAGPITTVKNALTLENVAETAATLLTIDPPDNCPRTTRKMLGKVQTAAAVVLAGTMAVGVVKNVRDANKMIGYVADPTLVD